MEKNYICIMWFLILLFIVLVGGCWFISKLAGNLLFPEKEKSYNDDNDSQITINNHIINQHLHITPEELEKLRKKS